MAPEAQFASLDGTALYGEDYESQPNPNAIARRSMSIFSRRGSETPEPKPPFIAQAAMPTPKKMTERQRSWIKRRSCPTASSSPSKPRGTILNAVPAATTIQMTALEEEMATSPNEEIMSAIGDHSPAQFAMKSDSRQTTPKEYTGNFWNKSTISLTQRTKSEKRKEADTRIGVWQNGITHWDGKLQERFGSEEPSLQEQTGFAPLLPNPAEVAQSARPHLSVVIPGHEPLVNDTTISTIVQPMPQHPVVSVAPASIVSKFAFSTPAITVNEHYDVSPLESVSRDSTPTERPTRPVQIRIDPDVSPNNKRQAGSRSSSTSSSTPERDDGSLYSKRSSATSVDAIAMPGKENLKSPGTLRATASKTFSFLSPAEVGVFDDASRKSVNLNKPLPPNPLPNPERSAPAPPSSPSESESRHIRKSSIKSAPDGRRAEASRPAKGLKPARSSRSLTQLDLIDQEFMRSSPYVPDLSEPSSPTLSQAQDDLEAHLSAIAEHKAISDDDVDEWYPTVSRLGSVRRANQDDDHDCFPTVSRRGSVRRGDSVRSVMHPPDRAPTLPKRSRKRDWRVSRNTKQSMQVARRPTRRRSEASLMPSFINVQKNISNVVALRRSASAAEASKKLDTTQLTRAPSKKALPPPRIVIDDGLIVLHGPIVMHDSVEEGVKSSASAEVVLLHILSALKSTDDLFNTALINKGMYRVYKENEMDLLRTVTYNQSPAAWEFREWCPPEGFNASESGEVSSLMEHTPKTYMRCLRRDLGVIESLKALILARCQTFIRRETAFAFATPNHPNTQRFNDAFWRIWGFCKIFGCGKGREDDVTGQLDWLKGGLLANNQDLTATMNMNLDFDFGSVLLNAPEFFAKGNAGGLSAQQLYDMTEIWTCLRSLLQAYASKPQHARRNGVFEECDVAEDQVENEEHFLDEWISHLLTLGPTVVLEMAEFANDNIPAGFALAKVNGWTAWSPPQYNGSRSTFLKEPVSRLYEERVAAAALKLRNPREREKKELSRKRVAKLAAEIKLARQASTYKRLPMIDMSSERPMSVLSRSDSVASTHLVQSQASVRTKRKSTSSLRRAPNFSTPRPNSPPSTLWAPRKISPIIEDRVETFNRMSLQNFAPGVAENTSDLAIRRIVDMGFTSAEAKESLRVCDMGDGLRVDRAVDWLLRQRS